MSSSSGYQPRNPDGQVQQAQGGSQTEAQRQADGPISSEAQTQVQAQHEEQTDSKNIIAPAMTSYPTTLTVEDLHPTLVKMSQARREGLNCTELKRQITYLNFWASQQTWSHRDAFDIQIAKLKAQKALDSFNEKLNADAEAVAKARAYLKAHGKPVKAQDKPMTKAQALNSQESASLAREQVMREEIDGLKESWKATGIVMESMRDDIKELKMKFQESASNPSTTDKSVSESHESIIKKLKSDHEQEILKLNAQIAQISRALTETLQENQMVQKEPQNQDSVVQELQKELQKCNSQKMELESAQEDLLSQIAGLQYSEWYKQDALEQLVQRLDNDYKESKEEKEALVSRVEIQEKQIDELAARNVRLQKGNMAFFAEKEDLNKALLLLNDQVGKERIGHTNEQIELQKQVEELQKELENSNDQKKAFEAEVESLTKKLERMQCMLDCERNDRAHLVQKLENDVIVSMEEKNSLVEKVESAQKQVEELQKEIEKCNDEEKKSNDLVHDLSSELEYLNAVFKSTEEDKEELTQRLKNNKEQKRALAEKLESAEKRIRAMTDQNDCRNKETESEIEKLRSDIAHLEYDNELTTVELRAIHKQKEELVSQVETLKKQFQYTSNFKDQNIGGLQLELLKTNKSLQTEQSKHFKETMELKDKIKFLETQNKEFHHMFQQHVATSAISSRNEAKKRQDLEEQAKVSAEAFQASEKAHKEEVDDLKAKLTKSSGLLLSLKEHAIKARNEADNKAKATETEIQRLKKRETENKNLIQNLEDQAYFNKNTLKSQENRLKKMEGQMETLKESQAGLKAQLLETSQKLAEKEEEMEKQDIRPIDSDEESSEFDDVSGDEDSDGFIQCEKAQNEN